jgi:hypothetical protein
MANLVKTKHTEMMNHSNFEAIAPQRMGNLVNAQSFGHGNHIRFVRQQNNIRKIFIKHWNFQTCCGLAININYSKLWPHY